MSISKMVNEAKKGELAWWLDAHCRYFARPAAREGFELHDDILMVSNASRWSRVRQRAAAPLWGSRSMNTRRSRQWWRGSSTNGAGSICLLNHPRSRTRAILRAQMRNLHQNYLIQLPHYAYRVFQMADSKKDQICVINRSGDPQCLFLLCLVEGEIKRTTSCGKPNRMGPGRASPQQ